MLRQGIRREHVLPVVAVCAAADALLIAAGIAGLGALVTDHPAVLAVTRYGGAAFLLVLAVGAALRARRPERLDPAADGPAAARRRADRPASRSRSSTRTSTSTPWCCSGRWRTSTTRARGRSASAPSLASITWFTALGFGAAYLRPVFARPRAWQVLDVVIAVVMAALAVLLLV